MSWIMAATNEPFVFAMIQKRFNATCKQNMKLAESGETIRRFESKKKSRMKHIRGCWSSKVEAAVSLEMTVGAEVQLDQRKKVCSLPPHEIIAEKISIPQEVTRVKGPVVLRVSLS